MERGCMATSEALSIGITADMTPPCCRLVRDVGRSKAAYSNSYR